jgi:hypothetical protein
VPLGNFLNYSLIVQTNRSRSGSGETLSERVHVGRADTSCEGLDGRTRDAISFAEGNHIFSF